MKLQELCNKLEIQKLQCRFDAVLLESLLLYRVPLVRRSSSDRLGHVAANLTSVTRKPIKWKTIVEHL